MLREADLLKSVYTLKGFEKFENARCAVIGLELKTTTESIPLKKEEEEVSLGINIEGEGTGEIVYDYKNSRVLASKMTLELNSIIDTEARTGRSRLDTSQRVEMNLKTIPERRKK